MIVHNKPSWQNVTLLVLLSLTWGSSFYFIKIGVAAASPLGFTTIRLVCGGIVCVLGYLALRHNPLPQRLHQLYPFGLVALGGNVIPFLLIGWGELFAPSTEAAIIIGVMPCFALLLGAMFLPEETLSLTKVIGISLGLGAIVALLGNKQPHSLATISFVLAALSFAATAVYGRRLTQSHSAWDIVALSTIIAAIMIALLWLWQGGGTASLATMSTTSLGAAMLMGLLHTVLGGLAFFYLLKTCGIVFTSFCNYGVPVMGSFWGWLLLNEALGWHQLLALALVLAGLVVVRNR